MKVFSDTFVELPTIDLFSLVSERIVSLIDPDDTELYIPEEHQCQTTQVVGLNIFYKTPH